jgi:beta-lactam-binding protein with PASTA domain
MGFQFESKQRGISLSGTIFVLVILAVLAVFAMKLVPPVSEYMSIKKAITTAKSAGTTVHEIQSSFDKQADINNISAITGKDLEIVKNGENIVVSFAYEKKIPLTGPASLLLEFSGSTDENAKKQAAPQ